MPRLVGYAEWATRLAMHNSQTGADVVREAPDAPLGLGCRPAVPGLGVQATTRSMMHDVDHR